MKNFDLEKENGRSMIEMLGVLAIIGVLSVGGIAGYSKAMQKYRINKAIEQITLIAGNVRSFFAPQRSYNDLTRCDQFSLNGQSCKIILKAKILPDEMITFGTKENHSEALLTGITNPFGYGIGLERAVKSVTNDNKAFSIYYNMGDDENICIELLTQDWKDAKVISLSDGTYPTIFLKTPVAVDTAVEKCSAINEATANSSKARGWPSVHFYFDIDVNSTYWQNKLNTSS